MKKPSLVILDRDGVINHDSELYVKSPEEWQPIEGSIEAIAQLHQNGIPVVVATNQSGLARGYFDRETLGQIHDKMEKLVEQAGGKLSGIFFCPHGPDDNCDCRKPKPGMVFQIQEKLNLTKMDLKNSVFVGDSLRDLQAAIAGGCQPVLVRSGNGKKTEISEKLTFSVPVYDDLKSCADAWLS